MVRSLTVSLKVLKSAGLANKEPDLPQCAKVYGPPFSVVHMIRQHLALGLVAILLVDACFHFWRASLERDARAKPRSTAFSSHA
jgi:hypothetical protein